MTSLDTLKGLGAVAIEKLATVGITETEELANASIDTLASAGITEGRAQRAIDLAKASIGKSTFKTGLDVLERRKKVQRITTNVPELDALLGGGVETDGITEFYGAFGSGKSQFMHQLAVNCCLPVDKGGLDGSVIWIDAERTFRPNRVEEMVIGAKKIHGIDLDYEDVLSRLNVAEALTAERQMELVDLCFDVAKDIKAAGKPPVRVIIVDSLIANFRAEFCGREHLAERQQSIGKHMNTLARFSAENNAAVLVTNQVQANPQAFFGDPNSPTGGNIVGHSSKSRLYIRKGKKGSRVVKLVDSPDRPDGEAACYVITDGIVPLDWDDRPEVSDEE